MVLTSLGLRVIFSPTYKKSFKYVYPLLTRSIRKDEVLFLNWSYEEDPPMELPLEPSDEPNRVHINLYHRTAAQADLSGKKVLEVSCGHGGGASYLTRTLHPASYTGLDLNPRGIELCRTRYDLANLDFVHGDAENLPFDDESFDAVINIEASHCYPNFPRFLAEVVRVLRPGGHFLYADIRPGVDIARWEAELADASMRRLSGRDINAEVVRGIEKNSQRSRDLIKRNAPVFLRRPLRRMAAVQGTLPYRFLQKGILSYRMYSFVKD